MAAGATYEPIATTTLGSTAASVIFSSISGSYTDLVVITNTGNGSAFSTLYLQVGNGSADTGSNYSTTFMYGTGSSTISSRTSGTTQILASATNNALDGNGSIFLQNYSNTTTYKTVLSRGNTSDGIAVAYVGLWRSTSAINYIKLTDQNGHNFSIGSTFTLYGIAAA
jgi:hypothetical protein